MRNLHERVAVVTGAASGIGRATAVELARHGCHLAIADRDDTGLRRTAHDIAGLGRDVSTHTLDVASKAAMEELVRRVLSRHGRVHVLVNNAGVAVAGALEQHRLEDVDWIVGTNLLGVIYACKLFLPYLRRVDEGHIVNMSSLMGLSGFGSYACYCATKFAIRGFSEALSLETAGSNVGVTAVYPGAVKTNIARNSRLVDALDTRLRAQAVAYYETRSLTPETVAQKIVRAILRGTERLLVSPDVRVVDAIKRLLPVASTRFLDRLSPLPKAATLTCAGTQAPRRVAT